MKKISFVLTALALVGHGYAQNLYSLGQSGNTANNGVVLSGVTMGKDGVNSSAWIQSYNASGPDPLQLNPLGGNVGIGTINPLTAFHVAGPYAKTNTSGFLAAFISTNELSSGAPFGLRTMVYGGTTIANRYVTLQTTDYASLDGGNLILQPATGYVGIGTTTPSNKLDILSNNERVHMGNGTADLYLGQWDNANNRIESVGRSLYFTTYTGAINFGISGLTSLSIANSGNVLIGQTAQVNAAYKLDVNGSMRANEIVVNTSGADFVFDPGYQLPGLDKVKAYIEKNHHLPQIASAAEMEKEGQSIAEFNTKLLQKVEELTLYMIRQKEETAGLQQQVIRQQRQIQRLEKSKKIDPNEKSKKDIPDRRTRVIRSR